MNTPVWGDCFDAVVDISGGCTPFVFIVLIMPQGNILTFSLQDGKHSPESFLFYRCRVANYGTQCENVKLSAKTDRTSRKSGEK
ncbi:hypothetical protein V8J88_10745 [Massilia sp. W12]|uniref:hypothetical protein n=1 Tax=Massilia sp. W12 TaxID=3126507 RepID=UPI0030CC1E3E